MLDWNTYVETHVADLVREANSERMLKQAMNQAKSEPRKPWRTAIGERLIVLGWRMLEKQPQQGGETCSRTMISGFKQAIVMVEVCV